MRYIFIFLWFYSVSSIKKFETLFNKNGAGVINCMVDESYVKKLLGYFKHRA